MGGGAYLYAGVGGSSVLTNCTFAANAVSQLSNPYAGGVVLHNGTVSLSNCLFWGNVAQTASVQAKQIALRYVSSATLEYTTIEGWDGTLGGTGNGGSDPLFLDLDGPDNAPGTADDNPRLGAGSPAIDSGNSLALPVDIYDIDDDGNITENLPLDLDGNPRFFDNPNAPNTGPGSPPHVDRGAYESQLAEAVWLDGDGGGFTETDNWQGGVIPNSITRAYFDDRAGGTNLAYTVILPSNQTAYAVEVLANQVSFNLFGGSAAQSGNLTLVAPPGDPRAALRVGSVPNLDTRLIVLYSGGTGTQRSLVASDVVLADAPGSIGQLTIRTQRAKLQTADPNTPVAFVDVGRAGAGTLLIDQRATAALEGLRLARLPSSTGTLTVVGQETSASTLSYGGIGTDFIIGEAGTATVDFGSTTPLGIALISAGDTTDPVDRVILGHEAGSSGTVVLRGAGTLWINSGDEFIVGDAGSATLRVLDGAELITNSGQLVLGRAAGSTAEVVIGAGSSWFEGLQQVQVAGDGTATLTIHPEGTLNLGDGGGVSVNGGGTLAGGGTVNGNLFAVGTVDPDGGTELPRGASTPGTLTVSGDYQQIGIVPGGAAESGALAIDVAGVGPDQYDRLVVTGSAELGGGLFVNLANGFTPDPNQALNLPVLNTGVPLAPGSRFDVAFFPGITGSRFLSLEYPDTGRAGDITLVTLPLPGQIDLDAAQQAPVPGVPNAVAVGDFDRDGLEDLVVSVPGDPNTPGQAVVLLTRYLSGSGTYAPQATSYTVGVEPAALTVGEFDGVPGLDIAVANAGSDSVMVLTNNGDPNGTFTPVTPATTFAVGHQPRAIAHADFDRDGREDLVVGNAGDSTVQILLGTHARGLFNPLGPAVPAGGVVQSVDPFDPDNDDDPDIATGNQDGKVGILVNTSSGPGTIGFQPVFTLSVGAGAVQLGSRDLRGVGRPDLITVNRTDGTVSVLVNTTVAANDVSFAPAVDLPVGSDPRALALLDLDGDQDDDVVVIAENDQQARVARVLRNDQNAGQLAFAPATDLDAGPDPVALGVGDLNADGKRDLVVLNAPGARETDGEVFVRLNAPSVPGDLNGDGLVNFADAQLLADCMGGPNVPISTGCGPADLQDDLDVDLGDLADFQWRAAPRR